MTLPPGISPTCPCRPPENFAFSGSRTPTSFVTSGMGARCGARERCLLDRLTLAAAAVHTSAIATHSISAPSVAAAALAAATISTSTVSAAITAAVPTSAIATPSISAPSVAAAALAAASISALIVRVKQRGPGLSGTRGLPVPATTGTLTAYGEVTGAVWV